MKMKKCPKCKKQKPFSGFYKDKSTELGITCYCKICISKRRQKYYQSHKIKEQNRIKKYQQAHKDKCIKWTRKYRQSLSAKQRLAFRAADNKRHKEFRKTIIGALYNRFQAIKQRCNNSKCRDYNSYGGRGIKCLFKNVNEFIDYVIDVLKIDPRGLDIDRINNDGHYKPGNIRFVTHVENCNNRKRK